MMHREEDKHTAKARSRQRLWRTGPTEMGVYWLKIKLSRYRGFPGGAVVKNPPANAGDTRDPGSVSGLERSPGGGPSNPLQYSCLENLTDRRAWWAIVQGVAELDMID